MPYSFTQIEKEKSQVITWVFLFLVGFYFLVAWLLYMLVKHYFIYESHSSEDFIWQLPSLVENGRILLVAACVGAGHWCLSTTNLSSRILSLLGAKPLNLQDQYHQLLQNVIDEVSVATGGKKISGRVIPSSAMNAFAVMDFDNQAVIGVTEGLLARLSRPQLEAVVGHEAAHIVSGDCLSTTVITSLFGVYDSMLRFIENVTCNSDRGGQYRASRRGGGLLMMVYGLLLITKFMSVLLQMFISRQRELRADAVAVRLTRDPLSLAQALYAISYRWRGSGLNVDQLQSIFIVNPDFSALDEGNGLWSDLFSTHPPVKQRLEILLGLAKASVKDLEDSFKNVQPVAVTGTTSEVVVPQTRWMVYGDNVQWQGLFTAAQLRDLTYLTPDTWVKREGGEVVPAYLDPELKQVLRGDKLSTHELECPRCHVPLSDFRYEGVPIRECFYCKGALVFKNEDVQTILIRKDMKFSDRIYRLADTILEQQKNRQIAPVVLKGADLFDCPKCLPLQNKMIRKFYSLVYPIEIDQCTCCEATWFDGDELEILQCLVEKQTAGDFV